MQKIEAKNIDEYIAAFPSDVRERLEQIRNTVRKAAPKAQEAIKYGIPTFVLGKNLVHFAAYKTHIGFYPAPRVPEFRKAIEPYFSGKGTLQFPLSDPLPLALIAKVTKYRVSLIQEDGGENRKRSR